MRTTLTLDDDLAVRLRELARSRGVSFKEVVNETLRRGLSVQVTGEDAPPYRVKPFRSPLRPGIDPLRLNQLVDDLEIDRRPGESE